jgi:molybdopterin molybdotransferase
MDGYALRAADTREAVPGRPVRLRIVGESRAGVPFSGQVGPGEAVRISTGAKIPSGADAVVPVEKCHLEGEWLLIERQIRVGAHIRYAGEEFRRGEKILAAGTVLYPGAVGLLASQGVNRVTVFRRPRVSVLVTGTELVPYTEDELQPGQIRDSNAPMLAAALRASGAEVVYRGQIADEKHHTVNTLQEAADRADFVLLTGGVSVGPHDLVKGAAETVGFEPLFWKVRQKPGKPLFVAKRGKCLLFGLPGNPVSALTCYAYYVHPALAKFSGLHFRWHTVKARLRNPVHNRGNRSLFLRVRLERSGETEVIPLEAQGSHMLTSVALADGFLLLQPEEGKQAGEEVDIYLYPWRQIWHT